MTPKEKAQELTDPNRWWMCTKEQCKKYALIVVDEVLKEIDNTTLSEVQSEYWETVKDEIEKIK